MVDKEKNKNQQALKDFLLDIDCLNELSKWDKRVNLFDILKISKAEIRHSNILSWLLDPNGNHGLGDRVIRGFIRYTVSHSNEDPNVFNDLLIDCHDFMIQREWRNIDILATSAEEHVVLCIENKIDSGEHDNQLIKYQTIVRETYPDWRKIFIFLSPGGYDASESDWCTMGYQNVLDIIERAENQVTLAPNIKLLIENYTDTIRRNVMEDKELVQVCESIYKKHQQALDLIFENKPDKAKNVAAVLKKWAIKKTEEGEIEVALDKCDKTYTRFKTKGMSAILPDTDKADSGWGTNNNYFYEIVNEKGLKFHVQLVFSALNISEEQKKTCEMIRKLYPPKINKENWVWSTVKTYAEHKVQSADEMNEISDGIDEVKICNDLNRDFEEIKKFEDELKKKLSMV